MAASSRETSGRYPEYDLVWSDGRLDVVALFGVIVESSPRDWAFVSARGFVRDAQRRLHAVSVASQPSSSSVLDATTVTGTIMVGGRERDVRIDVLVVPKLSEAGPDFEDRYGPLSASADLVLYNGHAGLGTEVAAFSRAGRVEPDKYQLVLLNGCQTFAYIDTMLNDRRRDVNRANDPNGTRYLDVVANALTSRTENFVATSRALLEAALEPDAPRSYREILAAMPPDQIPVVFGEEDNRYTP